MNPRNKNDNLNEFFALIAIITLFITGVIMVEVYNIDFNYYLMNFIAYIIVGAVLIPVIAFIIALFPPLIYPFVLVFYPLIRLWQWIKK